MSAGAATIAHDEAALLELRRFDDRRLLREFLSARRDLVMPCVVEQLAELVRKRLRIDVEEALGLADAALEIAVMLDDAQSLGRGYRAKANALWFKGDCRAAVELFDKAIAHFEQSDLAVEIGRTLSSSIQPLSLLGEYDQALAAASRARQIFLTLGDGWRIARLEINVANILHRQDRFADALASYVRAYEDLAPYKDAEGIGVALHNIAVCLIMLNDFERALSCYQRVRAVCADNGMPLLALQADYNIAYLFFLRGDYDTAMENLRVTRDSCRESGDAYHAALCDLDHAEIYVELNLTDEAVRMAESASRQFEALGMSFETGRSLANLAIAHQQKGEGSRALELFEKARGVFAREGNQPWQALINLYQALVLCAAGEHAEAQRLCEEAREFFSSAYLERRVVLCDLLLARLSLRTGNAADTSARCAAVLARLSASDAPLLTFQAHLLTGHAARASGQLRAAYRSYRKAGAALETLRGSVQGEELKISFLKDKVEVYQGLVEICLQYRSGKSESRALRYIEQAKSRSLAELVFGRGNRVAWREAGGPSAAKLVALRGELNWLYHRIETEQTAQEGISIERIDALRADARRTEDEFLRVMREMEGQQPRSRVLEATAAAMEPEEIRAALHPDAVLLEYFEAESNFLAAVTSRHGTQIVPLAAVTEVSARMRMLEFQLSKFRLRGSYPRQFEAALLSSTQNRLRELYRDLIAPLAPLLKGRHLVVAPHGILHYVPFHALLDGSESLVDRFTISYAPSGSIYAMCEGKAANPTGPSLLMGVPDLRAPCINREIRSVAAVVEDPKVFLGETATADRLRSVGAQSRIIHIATHGMFRRDNPMFSGVRLAESYLNLYDLYDLRLPVELFTLSGCGTGLSAVAAGDELLGLIRGLLGAGAQTLLLSMWDLYDETTADFMASFYRHLRREREVATALRIAMLEARETHPHPYYWAPFVIVGKAFNAAW